MTSSARTMCCNSPMFEAIKILDTTPKIFDDKMLYLFSIKHFEDSTKQEDFLARTFECRVHYLCYFLNDRDV